MNKKIVLLILILVFVLLIGSASVLYSQLGQNLAPNQLASQPTEASPKQIGRAHV